MSHDGRRETEDIPTGESARRQGREKQLVDHLVTGGANGSGSGSGRMAGHDHAQARPAGGKWDVWAIKEGTGQAGFRVGDDGIWGRFESRLDLREIEEVVILATCDPSQFPVQQIEQGSRIPIQAVQTHNHAFGGKKKGCRRGGHDVGRTLQLLAIIAVAWPRERAEPLRGMRLQDGGPRSHDFPSFPPEIAFGRDLLQSSPRLGQGGPMRQGTLSCGRLGAIDIHDQPRLATAIPEPTWTGMLSPREHIFLKDLTERFDSARGNGGKETAEGGTMRKALAAKEGHEGLGKWGETITKIEQGRFSAEGIANEHGDEIDHAHRCQIGHEQSAPAAQAFSRDRSGPALAPRWRLQQTRKGLRERIVGKSGF